VERPASSIGRIALPALSGQFRSVGIQASETLGTGLSKAALGFVQCARLCRHNDRGAAMRRREFISVIAGAAVLPLGARAEQAAMPVIGFLAPAPASGPTLHLDAAFRQGLAEAGYVEGKNLAIEYRFANFRPELIPEFAGDLVRLNVNVIFASTPEAVAAVKDATTSISVVALDLESDPVAKGYVKSLARPGGNMTGMFLDIPELSGKQVALLKEDVPRLSRIAIFGIRGLNAAQFAATEMATRALALEAEVMEVRVADDFERALRGRPNKAC
jgi:ABC-type uncharacterized transport system substrate-binding protein